MEHQPSEQQATIFNEFETGSGHVLVLARAGTGKTTTIIEGINRAPDKRILLAAFSKKIADELTARVKNPNAMAKTLHAVGMGIVRSKWNDITVDTDRGDRIIRGIVPSECPDDVIFTLKKLVSRCKNTTPFPTVDSVIDEAIDADLEVSAEQEDEGWTMEFIAKTVIQAMEAACKRDGTIDFDDMVFLPVRNKWVYGRFDLIVIDEAQDMNYTQIMLARGLSKKGGRIFVVGDDRQAIYGFRGADHSSMDKLKKALNAKVLNLNITYRCPKLVVNMAKVLVPDYQAAPAAPEGVIESMGRTELVKAAQPGDFVLSRKNAPLAQVCLAFLRANKRAIVEGRMIGEGLVKLVKRLKGKSMPDFLGRLKNWQDKELNRAQRLEKSKRDVKEDLIKDQYFTLVELSDGLTGVKELVARIENLFSDQAEKNGSYIICSSVHRSKGLERDNVYLLEETFSTGLREEANIRYVAITRAKKRLVLVSAAGAEQPKK